MLWLCAATSWHLLGEITELQSNNAAMLAAQMRLQLLREERSFCFEIFFSHPSKIDFVAQAKTAGY